MMTKVESLENKNFHIILTLIFLTTSYLHHPVSAVMFKKCFSK